MRSAQSQKINTVAVFGFSDEERKIILSYIEKSPAELFQAEYATDLFANEHLMVIVNVPVVPATELQQLLAYYKEVPDFSETVFLVGDCSDLQIHSRITVYPGFDELQSNLKYLLLAAHKQKKSAESFSRSVSYALIILKLITENPGISSKEISDRLELSPRTVTRYIETLNMSGESIVYDRKSNGWSLQYDEPLLKL